MLKADEIFGEFHLFETLFSQSKQNSILIMDKTGIIKDVNDQFLKSFGYTRDEIIGSEAKMLFTKEDQLRGLPEKELENVIKYGQAMDNNYLVNKNETITWVSGESVLAKNKEGDKIVLKIIQDIQGQKVSEASILKLHEFNENILRSIEDIVMVVDSKMNIVKSNKAIEGLFKMESTGTPQNLITLIKPYDTKNEVSIKINSCIDGNTGFTKSEIEIENNKNEKRIYNISCCAIEQQKKNGNVLVVIHDITEQKQAEREREDIIGFVAHELRNPLANIVLCNEILNEAIQHNNFTEMNEMLQRSKNNVMRLNKMIAELYDATKASAGNLRLDTGLFNFQDMINEAVETVKGLQPLYNIIVNGNSNIVVRGDKFRLIQVVINFISNGIKYSNGNNTVLLNVHNNEHTVTVSVKDEGLGICTSQLPHIFERFFRAEKTRNLEGIGLGLYLCKQIINAHNGKIWAESEEGKGSTFYFSIPL